MTDDTENPGESLIIVVPSYTQFALFYYSLLRTNLHYYYSYCSGASITKSKAMSTTTTATTTHSIEQLVSSSAGAPVSTTSSPTSGLVQRRHPPSTTTPTAAAENNDVENTAALHLDYSSNHDSQKFDVLTWEKVEPRIYKRKPKNIRRFYKEQNDLIDRLQSFYQLVPTSEEAAEHRRDAGSTEGEEEEEDPPEPAPVARAIHLSFALNVLLLAVKIIASILSGSMSVIASAADSLLDLLSGSVLVITHRLVVRRNKGRDTLTYPQGKSRMEPIGVFAFAIIMMLSSLQIVIEAVRRLVSRPDIEIGPVTLGILTFTIGSKAVASWYCRKVARAYGSGAATAYADDHRNDVMTNFVGVGAALAAVYVPSLWFLDSTGAICIAVYIIYCWIHTGHEQLHFLTGRGASPMLLQQLTYIAANHDERILYVDTVRAFHFGVNYLVEVDIVLPEDMPLRESHDIGESLQERLEQLEDVERAFVHNDYEWDHSPVVFRGSRVIRK